MFSVEGQHMQRLEAGMCGECGTCSSSCGVKKMREVGEEIREVWHPGLWRSAAFTQGTMGAIAEF